MTRKTAEAEYKIGEIAELLGTTLRAIRYYEEEGLLEPARSQGGTRYYNHRHIARLRAILRLAQNGFSIESIRQIAGIRETCRTGDEGSDKVGAHLNQEVKRLTAKIQELERLKAELAQAKAMVGKCRGCMNPPSSKGCPTCPVKRYRERLELANLIWDQEA